MDSNYKSLFNCTPDELALLIPGSSLSLFDNWCRRIYEHLKKNELLTHWEKMVRSAPLTFNKLIIVFITSLFEIYRGNIRDTYIKEELSLSILETMIFFKDNFGITQIISTDDFLT